MREGVTMLSGEGKGRGTPSQNQGGARRVTTSYFFHSEGDGNPGCCLHQPLAAGPQRVKGLYPLALTPVTAQIDT
jgi:hypothetical protein